MSAHEFKESPPSDAKPNEQESTLEIQLQLKRQVMEDILSDGARVLFCWLNDCSWVRYLGGIKPGVIAVSISTLARRLRRDPRSIIRWHKELQSRKYIWLSKHPLPNARPINVYHISKLDPELPNGKQPTFFDGMWGGGGYGDTVTMGVHGKWAKGAPGETPANTDDAQGIVTLSHLPGDLKSPANGAGSHVQGDLKSPANGTGSHLQGDLKSPASTPLSHVGGDLKSPPSTPKKPLAGDKKVNGQVTKTSIFKETPQGDSGGLGGLGASSKRLEANRAGAGPVENENDFLRLCLEVFGDREMRRGGPKGEGNGGLWRTLYRNDAGKAKAVLLETRQVKMERPNSLKTNWAAYAMDLWKNNRVAA